MHSPPHDYAHTHSAGEGGGQVQSGTKGDIGGTDSHQAAVRLCQPAADYLLQGWLRAQHGVCKLGQPLSLPLFPPLPRLFLALIFALSLILHTASVSILVLRLLLIISIYICLISTLLFHGLLLICLRASICMKAWIQPTDKSILICTIFAKHKLININVARKKLQLH